MVIRDFHRPKFAFSVDRRRGKCYYNAASYTHLKIFDFIQSHPDPDGWLGEKEQAYDAAGSMPSTVWGQVVMAHIVGVLRHAQHLIDTALLLTEDVYKRQSVYCRIGLYFCRREQRRGADMLELLLGRSGTGKTHTVFDELTRLAEQDEGLPLYLLVPEQFSFRCV